MLNRARYFCCLGFDSPDPIVDLEAGEASNARTENTIEARHGQCYFGTHFNLGGQRFLTADSENFLFEGLRTEDFPDGSSPHRIARPARVHKTATIRSPFNVNRETLRLIPVAETAAKEHPLEESEDDTEIEPHLNRFVDRVGSRQSR